MAYNYNPQNQIFAGSALLGVSSEPTIFSTPITLTASTTESTFGDTINVANGALISGYVSQASNTYVLATVRNTGEHVIIGDVVTNEIDLVRGWLGKHPNYLQAIENGGSFWKAIASGYSIDCWGQFTMPSIEDYIEANGIVTVDKTQDVFMTMDNASEYDTYTSKQPSIKLTANLPWNMVAHPQGIGAVLSNEIVTNDSSPAATNSYSQLVGAISAGQKLTNKLVIVLPKSELGSTINCSTLNGFSQLTKVVQRHQGAILLWRVGITPKHKDAFDPTKQMELELEGNGNALIGNVYNTAGTTVKRSIVAPGVKNFTLESHAIVPSV